MNTGGATASSQSSSVCGRRVVVVGVTGSGKTTLARQISQRLAIPHVELDALHWGPHWMPAPPDVFRERLVQALSGEAWVVDGNYGKGRDVVWGRADTVVWLDYSLSLILWRLAGRTVWRIVTREELWGGNREDFFTQFFTRDSLFVWALNTYRRRRADYPRLLASPEYAHLIAVRLRSPQAARAWLRQVEQAANLPDCLTSFEVNIDDCCN